MKNPNTLLADIAQLPALKNTLALIARFLLALIFILAGWGKISAYAATEGYMQAMGVPGGLLPLVILLELGGGLALLLGFQTRLLSVLFAVFCVVTGFIFHSGADQINQMMMLKNISMAGGFIALMLLGAGRFSIDRS
ncbi:DoxX family protein [Acinetobacter nematophilus]|uniref:DoxX family protein n=1 Tax=Acinetobacter nematophilus TaxID=2994642 RepID=UPI003AF963DD